MRYTIAYDNHNRLRLRCGDYVLTREKANGLTEQLLELQGVRTAQVNFRTGSILVTYTPGARQEILAWVGGLQRSQIPEVGLTAAEQADDEFRRDLEQMLAGRLLRKLIPSPIRNLMTIYRAVKYILRALDTLLRFEMDISVLDGVSIGASIAQGHFKTASSVMFLLAVSDRLEAYTKKRTRLALSEQLSLNVDSVWLRCGADSVKVPFDRVQVGDQVIVRTGSVIPFDGTVCDEEGMVNQATMTGESEAVHKKPGDSVFAGTTVEAGTLVVEVRSLAADSRLNQIISLIDESENLKAGVQSKAEHLADAIVPYSFLGFGLVWLLSGNLTKALSVLMVDFSCAIKLSTPISVISAMREAAEYGATVKGGKYLEAFAEADAIVFDKTGTLTNASPEVSDVICFNGFERDEVLTTAACLEEHFPHSMAVAVVKKAAAEGLLHEERHAEVEYLVAHGIVTHYGGNRAIIGSEHFVFEDEGIPRTPEQTALMREKAAGGSAIFLAIGGQLAGMLVIDDPVRREAKDVIRALRSRGIHRICMLTGDAESAAARVSRELGIDKYVAQVLPEHKSEFVKKLQQEGFRVIMTGDGVNDTPALAAADVSVAMSDGSDIAREVADVTLCRDDITVLVTVREISEKLMHRISSNYRFIAGFNAALILLGVVGALPPGISALLHNGSTMLIAAKSMTRLTERQMD